jgi:hypothetical protein
MVYDCHYWVYVDRKFYGLRGAYTGFVLKPLAFLYTSVLMVKKIFHPFQV